MKERSFNPDNVFFIAVAVVVITFKICNTVIRVKENG